MNIDPKDLCVGDKVRIVDAQVVVVTETSSEYIGVANVKGDALPSYKIRQWPFEGYTRTWELLDRPKPAPKLGSVWVDPEQDDEKWVALNGGRYARAENRLSLNGLVSPTTDQGRALIDRLVPAEGEAE